MKKFEKYSMNENIFFTTSERKIRNMINLIDVSSL